jgi:hypothetical protein
MCSNVSKKIKTSSLNAITQLTIVRDEKSGAGITVCWHSQIPTSAPLPSFKKGGTKIKEKEQSDTIKAHFLRNEHNKKTILTHRGKF